MARAGSSTSKILALCERAGFLFKLPPSTAAAKKAPPLQYYGPLGAQLKRNVIDEWWHSVVTSMGNVYPVDSPTVEANSEENTTNLVKMRSQLNQGEFYGACKEVMKTDLPFGIAECGKVFTTQKEYINSGELEIGAVNFFCSLSEHKNWMSHWRKQRLKWWKKFAASPEKFTLGQGEETEKEAAALLGVVGVNDIMYF